jgi:hypothetical protein
VLQREAILSPCNSNNIPSTHGKTKGPFVKYMKDIQTKLDKEAEKSDSVL